LLKASVNDSDQEALSGTATVKESTAKGSAHGLQCPVGGCRQTFSQRSSLERHLDRCHADEFVTKEEEPGEKGQMQSLWNSPNATEKTHGQVQGQEASGGAISEVRAISAVGEGRAQSGTSPLVPSQVCAPERAAAITCCKHSKNSWTLASIRRRPTQFQSTPAPWRPSSTFMKDWTRRFPERICSTSPGQGRATMVSQAGQEIWVLHNVANRLQTTSAASNSD